MEKLKILVVEDETISARIMCKRLDTYGYIVSSIVTSGEEAIVKIQENRPDLVLMDILLEGKMDGIETAGYIKELFDIPVVYITGYMDEKIIERIKVTEPYGHIIKPFSDKELHITVEMAVYKFKMKKRLRDREELFHTTLKSISDGVMTIDNSGFITFINSAAERLTGWTHSEALGKHLNEVFIIVDELTGKRVCNLAEDIMNRCITAGFSNHIMLITKDSKRISIEDKGCPIIDKKGNILGGVLTFHDITDIKQSYMMHERLSFDLAETISRTIEYRDPYTAGHQRRVAELAKRVGQIMGCTSKELDEIYIGGLLHDIGKVTIPVEILSKPSKLSSNEFNLIKEHPEKGCNIIKGTRLPWDIYDVIRHHHEKLDGSGYPDGISGDEISRNVRIITVCDVVESMSTFRPYRPANMKKQVLDELFSNRRIKYDENVVDIITGLIRSGEFNPWELTKDTEAV